MDNQLSTYPRYHPRCQEFFLLGNPREENYYWPAAGKNNRIPRYQNNFGILGKSETTVNRYFKCSAADPLVIEKILEVTGKLETSKVELLAPLSVINQKLFVNFCNVKSSIRGFNGKSVKHRLWTETGVYLLLQICSTNENNIPGEN